LNERQERILLSLKKLDYLNREQLQKLHGLGKVRNANRILKDLSPYLSSFREDYSTIYYLNKEGRYYVDSKKIREKTNFVKHVIARNNFYIFYRCPHNWKNEVKVTDGRQTIICDAWFKINDKYNFLEVDVQQSMKENRNKVERYCELHRRGAIREHLGYFPNLIWLTTTELRRKQLKNLCNELHCKIYTLDDIR
jgi:hypothetical protein